MIVMMIQSEFFPCRLHRTNRQDSTDMQFRAKANGKQRAAKAPGSKRKASEAHDSEETTTQQSATTSRHNPANTWTDHARRSLNGSLIRAREEAISSSEPAGKRQKTRTSTTGALLSSDFALNMDLSTLKEEVRGNTSPIKSMLLSTNGSNTKADLADSSVFEIEGTVGYTKEILEMTMDCARETADDVTETKDTLEETKETVNETKETVDETKETVDEMRHALDELKGNFEELDGKVDTIIEKVDEYFSVHCGTLSAIEDRLGHLMHAMDRIKARPSREPQLAVYTDTVSSHVRL